ncbi:MAG: TIGR04283 family arsenosugar biosynthesis glycosyltransferase, partial [Bacteroidota bacterium]|nr:TIGR04283 family arsenosugar biosynthesis glycosyltransferase [Bacteroidota bacterium]
YNESATLGKLLNYLKRNADPNTEIMVVDGGSTDDTVRIATAAGVRVCQSVQKGRASQMNAGAALARGEILYFVHADSLPPTSFCKDIREAITAGHELGRYRTRFDSKKWLLGLNAFFTRFDLFVCYGGDQTLFITKALFEQLGGYDKQFQIMEEYELVARARRMARYTILPKTVLVSARKYTNNSWWRVQKANYTIIKMYRSGASQDEMVKQYKKMLTLG